MLLAALGLAALFACATPNSEPRKNEATELRPASLVLISIDTLRADRLACYGSSVATPALDRFANEGAIFTQAFSQAPNTLPSHASMFLSQYPLTHDIHQGKGEGKRIPTTATSLTEVLRQAGYTTAAFTGGGLMSAELGFGQGFDLYRAQLEAAADKNQGVLEWLSSNPPEPFFLFLHYYDVHVPYDATNPYGPSYASTPPDHPAIANLRQMMGRRGKHLRKYLTSADISYLNGLYNNGVSYIDQQIGTVLDHIDSMGYRDQTTVIITSDHGESLGDHGAFLGHGWHLFDDILHVPLLIRGPRVKPGLVIDRLVELVDVAPTLLDAADLPVPAGMVGWSLLRTIEAHPVFSHVRLATSFDRRSIRTLDWKLVTDEVSDSKQLFDLTRDTHEKHDVAAVNPNIIADLEDQLVSWEEECRSINVGGSTTSTLSPEVVGQLEVLGYID